MKQVLITTNSPAAVLAAISHLTDVTISITAEQAAVLRDKDVPIVAVTKDNRTPVYRHDSTGKMRLIDIPSTCSKYSIDLHKLLMYKVKKGTLEHRIKVAYGHQHKFGNRWRA